MSLQEGFISHLFHPSRAERVALEQSIGVDIIHKAQQKTRRDVISGKKPRRWRYRSEAAGKWTLRIVTPALERNTQSISDRRETPSGDSFDISAEDATVITISRDVATSIIAGFADTVGYFPALGLLMHVFEQTQQLSNTDHFFMVLFGISLSVLTKEGYNVATNLAMNLLPSQNK